MKREGKNTPSSSAQSPMEDMNLVQNMLFLIILYANIRPRVLMASEAAHAAPKPSPISTSPSLEHLVAPDGSAHIQSSSVFIYI